jgi:hypothetical protein
MSLSALSADDKGVVAEAIRAILDGGFVGEFEYDARLGLRIERARELFATWPDLDDKADDSDAAALVNGSLNEICNGVHIPERDWARWFTVSKDHVKQVFLAWRNARGWRTTAAQ